MARAAILYVSARWIAKLRGLRHVARNDIFYMGNGPEGSKEEDYVRIDAGLAASAA
jgi:hypothetical protein